MTGERIVSGFRRLAAYPEAAFVPELRTILDRDPAAGVVALPQLEQAQRRALDGLDAVAAAMPWRPVDSIADFVDQPARFALALDQRDPRFRLRAIVMRAYARADLFAWHFAQASDDAERAAQLGKTLDAMWKALQEEVEPDLFDILRRRTYRPTVDTDADIEALRDGTRHLRGLAERLTGLGREAGKPGRTRGLPRFLFALRLGEAFAASTGIKPDFDDKRRVSAPWWNDMVRASLDLTGLGTQGLDDLLKKMNDDTGPTLDDDVPTNFRGGIERAAAVGMPWRSDEPFTRIGLSIGDLQSEGLMLDFALHAAPPAAAAEAYAPWTASG